MAREPRPGLVKLYGAQVRRRLAAVLVAGVAAGTLSTLVQAALWVAFTDAWPAILYRDARLAAAVVLGPAVLPPPATLDWTVMATATIVHFALSIGYAAIVAAWIGARPFGPALAIGVLFGLLLYAVNLHGFTHVYPWFAQARGWITVAAHVAFGVVAAAAWVRARPRRLA
jgi:hypothetical protein